MRSPSILTPLALLAAALLSAPPAQADVLELKDGRLVEGVVVQLDDSYLVRSRFGDAVVPVADVAKRHEARTIDEQVRLHVAGLEADDAENRALLARWLDSIGRADEAREMARAVLELDPESRVAHEVLGHVRHQGVWRTPDEAKRAEGLERHGDRWYTPEEWANQGTSARETALEAERKAEAGRIAVEVNRNVRLMMSPDKALRERGRSRLEAMSREYQNDRLAELARLVDDYVKKLDEVAAASRSVVGTPSGSGYVTGEFRATLSRLKRPIQEFSTSLASNIGGAPIRIQLPELEVIRVRTTGIIPVVVK